MGNGRVPYPDRALERLSETEAGADPGDDRHPFAKDRDRILYTSALRRLEGKSQVVASTEIGAFHTRLTHSLKVAQLGRRLAEKLRRATGARDGPGKTIAAPDPDLVEFACLAHDIGHPPFGHTGERELHSTAERLIAETVQRRDVDTSEAENEAKLALGGFEGNPQSFRIVTRLSHKWLDSDGINDAAPPSQWFGLNLTAASMDAISKYPYRRVDISQRKWGAYGQSAADGSDYERLMWARRRTGHPEECSYRSEHAEVQSFECQMMDWCDDVTYAVHDVEDFYMIGVIPLDRLFIDPSLRYRITPRNRQPPRSTPDGKAQSGVPTQHTPYQSDSDRRVGEISRLRCREMAQERQSTWQEQGIPRITSRRSPPTDDGFP